MEPIIILPYSEWVVAQQLSRLLPIRQGFSVYAPLSRQEKGVDLIVARRSGGLTHTVTLQVKSSRSYDQPESRGYKFGTRFNNFEPPEQADFFALVSLYPTSQARHKGKRDSWWSPIILLFTYEEMRSFVATVKTVGGKRDKMFGFGFSGPDRVIQIRGDKHRQFRDFSDHLVTRRIALLRKRLAAV